MQAIVRSFYQQASLVGARRVLPAATRRFATDLEVKLKEEAAVDVDSRNKRLGVDSVFSEQKHAYVLTFPWNFQEIISDFEDEARQVAPGSYWDRFVRNNATYEINRLFREFHQACALPDYELISSTCEGKLAQYVNESLRRIHFHGLDVEMANLTVEQPRLKVLKVELSHGLSVDRAQNKPASEYTASKSSLLGAPLTVYAPKPDTRDWLDHLDYTHKPYVVAATLLVESPMKLFVQNQNFSSVLFGSTDEELVKNVVRVETQVRWLDLFKVLGTANKPQLGWKITDFNNVLNENPYLPQY